MNSRGFRHFRLRASVSLFIHLIVIALLFLPGGCSRSDQNAGIRAFMEEVGRKPKSSMATMPEYDSYQAFTYSAADKRSPFEPPVVVSKSDVKQKKTTGVKPPGNHVRQELEQFNLASLSMVGTMQQNNATWALIRDVSGNIHRVEVGDYLGTQWGRVESINDTQIDIMEIVSDGALGYLRRPRTIELNGIQSSEVSHGN